MLRFRLAVRISAATDNAIAEDALSMPVPLVPAASAPAVGNAQSLRLLLATDLNILILVLCFLFLVF